MLGASLLPFERVHQVARRRSDSFFVSAAKFHQEPALALRQQRQIFRRRVPFIRMSSISRSSSASQPIGLAGHDFRDMVAGEVDIRVAQHQQRACRRIVYQPDGRFQNERASAFRADQRACHVKSILRQKFVQVVAGDAARNVGIMLADQCRRTCRGSLFSPRKSRRGGRPRL